MVSLKTHTHAKTARDRDFKGGQASVGSSQPRMGRHQNVQAELAMQQAMQLGINIKDGKVKKQALRQEIKGGKSVS